MYRGCIPNLHIRTITNFPLFALLPSLRLLVQGNLEQTLLRPEQTLLEELYGIVYGGKLLEFLTIG